MSGNRVYQELACRTIIVLLQVVARQLPGNSFVEYEGRRSRMENRKTENWSA